MAASAALSSLTVEDCLAMEDKKEDDNEDEEEQDEKEEEERATLDGSVAIVPTWEATTYATSHRNKELWRDEFSEDETGLSGTRTTCRLSTWAGGECAGTCAMSTTAWRAAWLTTSWRCVGDFCTASMLALFFIATELHSPDLVLVGTAMACVRQGGMSRREKHRSAAEVRRGPGRSLQVSRLPGVRRTAT